MTEETKLKESKTGTKLSIKDKSALLPAKTAALLAEGTVIRIFPSPKDIPDDNQVRALEVVERKLKITNSSEDIDIGYSYLKKLETLKAMLSSTDDLSELRKRTREQKELIGKVFKENMSNIFEKQRDIEKTYREIDTFFYEAQLNPGEKVEFVRFVNAHPDKNFDEITDAETGISSFLTNRDDFDMKSLVGLIVMPDWPGSEAKLLKYGEIAQHSAAHLFTGFPDMDMKEAAEMFEVGGEYENLKSTNRVKQFISVAANPLRIRRANQFESNLGDFFINPCGILAGKIYKGDIKEGIHIAQANKPHEVKLPTPDGSPLELKWNVRGAQQMKFNRALIPLAFFEGIVFWGVDTLYEASGQGDEGMDQYTVKRCDEYIAKCVLHFLNGVAFITNTNTNKINIQNKIQKFLNSNIGDAKMLLHGRVESVETVRDPITGALNNQALDIKVNVRYPNAVRQLNLYLVSEDEGHWKEK